LYSDVKWYFPKTQARTNIGNTHWNNPRPKMCVCRKRNKQAERNCRHHQSMV